MYFYILFISVGSITLITSLLMAIWFKTNRIMNIYLFILFSSCPLYLILHGLDHIFSYVKLVQVLKFDYFQAILALLPVCYLYFCKLVDNIKFPEKKDIKYFVPLVFCPVIGNPINADSLLKATLLYVVMFLYASYYLYKSYKVVKKCIWNGRKKWSSGYEYAIINPWTKLMFLVLVLIVLNIFVSKMINIISFTTECTMFMEGLLILLYLIIYFKVVFTPDILYGSPSLFKRMNSNSIAKLSINNIWKFEPVKELTNTKDIFLSNKINIDVPSYIEQIERIALVDNSFRASGYTLSNLAVEIGVPRYYIEFIFKYYCIISFNDYKKLVRIYDSIQLIVGGYLKSNTLNSLANHVGFASYNPFLINFKEITGVSPHDFYKNRKIEKSNFIVEEVIVGA